MPPVILRMNEGRDETLSPAREPVPLQVEINGTSRSLSIDLRVTLPDLPRKDWT